MTTGTEIAGNAMTLKVWQLLLIIIGSLIIVCAIAIYIFNEICRGFSKCLWWLICCPCKCIGSCLCGTDVEDKKRKMKLKKRGKNSSKKKPREYSSEKEENSDNYV